MISSLNLCHGEKKHLNLYEPYQIIKTNQVENENSHP